MAVSEHYSSWHPRQAKREFCRRSHGHVRVGREQGGSWGRREDVHASALLFGHPRAVSRRSLTWERGRPPVWPRASKMRGISGGRRSCARLPRGVMSVGLRRRCACLLSGSLAIASSARGEETATSAHLQSLAPDSTGQEVIWYGWQILLLDGAAATVAGVGAAKSDEGTFYVGLGSYLLLDGPLVHLLHGNGRSALRSLGLRTGLGLGTGLLAAAIGGLYDTEQAGAAGRSGCGTGADIAYGAAAGLANGLVAATIFDVALLGFERGVARRSPIRGHRLQRNGSRLPVWCATRMGWRFRRWGLPVGSERLAPD